MGAAVGIGLQGLSMVMGAVGEAKAGAHEAAQAKQASEIASIQADQIQTGYRQDLNTTIANIRAIRAATGANPDSPTSLAVIAGEEEASRRAMRIKSGAARIQSNQLADDARFLRASAKMSLIGGLAGAAGTTIQKSYSLASGMS